MAITQNLNAAGILYIVATPIGNLDDLSQRALQTLRSVDLIAAEDTRHSKQLLKYYNISRPLVSYHDHNEDKKVTSLIEKLRGGQNIALISDAGTPLICDPGYRLVKAAHEANIKVVPIPGACAAVAALSIAGLPSDRFSFEGFLPAKPGGRGQRLGQLAGEERTMIFYEAPHRIMECLNDMSKILGAERPAALVRELTKKFETTRLGSLSTLLDWVRGDSDQQRGEMVIVVSGYAKQGDDELSGEEEKVMKVLLAELPLSQAAAIGSKLLNISKKKLYDYGLSEKNNFFSI